MVDDGWEWPFLLLILAGYQDTWQGERAAMQEWTDTYLAWQSGDHEALARVRAFYRQSHLHRNGENAP